MPMARLLRIQYPGALYHVACRGNERKEIYQEDADRKRFLQILSQSPLFTPQAIQLRAHEQPLSSSPKDPRDNFAGFMRDFHIACTANASVQREGIRREGGAAKQRRPSFSIDSPAVAGIEHPEVEGRVATCGDRFHPPTPIQE